MATEDGDHGSETTPGAAAMKDKPKIEHYKPGESITEEEALLLAKCYDEGRRAFGTKRRCPYPSDGSGRRMRWWDGYLTARTAPLLQAAAAGARQRAENARDAKAANETPNATRTAQTPNQETTHG